MKWLLVIVLLFSLAGTAQAGEPWTESEKGWYGAFLAVTFADYMHSRMVVGNPDYRERNPILGENPSEAEVSTYFAVVTVGHFLIADQLGPKYRKPFIIVSIFVEALVVTQNLSIGLKF